MYAEYLYVMIKKHDDLVGSIVHDVAHLIRLRIDKKLKKFDLTRVKLLALGIIQLNPKMTQTELASELELGTAATGRLTDRLEGRGFVKRKSDRSDRRIRMLSLTPTAERLLDDMTEISAELRSEILDGIPQEDVQAMERGLKALKSNLASATYLLFASSTVNSNSITYNWAETLSFIA